MIGAAAYMVKVRTSFARSATLKDTSWVGIASWNLSNFQLSWKFACGSIKTFLVPNKFWVQNNVGSKTFWVLKKFGSKKIVGKKIHFDLTFPTWLDQSWLNLTPPNLTYLNMTCLNLTCLKLTCPNLTCPDLTCLNSTCPKKFWVQEKSWVQ